MEEALVNLIKNAIEHSPEASEIQIQVEDNQVYTCIHIRDFGSGISYEDQKHILERFYRSADAGEDSVGIGLALAQEIVISDGIRTNGGVEYRVGDTIRLTNSNREDAKGNEEDQSSEYTEGE